MTEKPKSPQNGGATANGKGGHHHNHHNGKHHHNNNNNNNNGTTTTAAGGNIPTKEDLWKNAEVKTLGDNAGWIVEMTGISSNTHTVYARAVQTADYKPSAHKTPSVREVVEGVVDVAWKHVAKHILEAKAAKKKQTEAPTKNGDAVEVAVDDEILRVDLDHWNQGAFPPAKQLLELGAVWLVNETSFLQQSAEVANKDNHKKKKHAHTKKKRLTSEDDGNQQPDWKDYVLRVHYAPNRYHAMEEVDWGKYCRGLLLGDYSVQVFLKGRMLAAHEHVPLSGYPNQKDGVIVYEVCLAITIFFLHFYLFGWSIFLVKNSAAIFSHLNFFFPCFPFSFPIQDAEHGFAVLNKPGTVPDHATVNNHAEDVLSVFSHVLHEREEEAKKDPKSKEKSSDPLYNHHHHRSAHLSLPLPLDTETQGLIIISTKRAFGTYLTHMVQHPPKPKHHHGAEGKAPVIIHTGVVKKYKCLICVKKPEDMLLLNNLVESGAVV